MSKIEQQPADLTALIRRALDASGYADAPATERELRICYDEYADALVTPLAEAMYNTGEALTVAQKCRALLRYKG